MNRPYDPDSPARCPLCRDTGAVIVPHPRCVSVRLGQLVTWPGSRGIRTCAVACSNLVPDAAGYPVTCPPGAALAASGSITWGRYTERVGGLDGVAMLLDMEAERARAARAGKPAETTLQECLPRWLSSRAAGSTPPDG